MCTAYLSVRGCGISHGMALLGYGVHLCTSMSLAAVVLNVWLPTEAKEWRSSVKLCTLVRLADWPKLATHPAKATCNYCVCE